VDPAFLARTQTPEEVAFLLLHETLHCAMRHLTRQGNRNHLRYNIAADIVVIVNDINNCTTNTA
jgi:predicted metal-dependent peptidase